MMKLGNAFYFLLMVVISMDSQNVIEKHSTWMKKTSNSKIQHLVMHYDIFYSQRSCKGES